VPYPASPDTPLVVLEVMMPLPEDDTTIRQLFDKYREFARDTLREDSGLAVWTDPNYQLIRQLAQIDVQIEEL